MSKPTEPRREQSFGNSTSSRHCDVLWLPAHIAGETPSSEMCLWREPQAQSREDTPARERVRPRWDTGNHTNFGTFRNIGTVRIISSPVQKLIAHEGREGQ